MKHSSICGVALVSLLLSFPKINFGQAPTIGTTLKSFAVFTATGAFSNVSPTSDVTGNVGTNAGAFTAFPPGTLNGVKHVANATSATAATEVLTAYSSFPAGGTVIGIGLGSGQTLIPGVYSTGAASTLNGLLTLDGGGNANALFIIKIGGALVTGTFATVAVTGSASLCNVYWQIGGQFDLGNGSIFRGTVIATGPINLLGDTKFYGRALSTAGAISLGPVGFGPDTVNVSGCDVLAVSFSSLTANRTSPANVLLRWETVTEINNSGFAIERSMGNNSWESVIFIPTQAPGGNSSSPLTYTFNDLNTNKGLTQYRIKQVDLDGRAKFSEVRVVRGIAQKGKIIVYPNPSADGSVNIVFEDQEGIRDVAVTDITGRTIQQWKSVSSNTLQIENLKTGIYTLRIIMRESGNQRVEKIIVSQY